MKITDIKAIPILSPLKKTPSVSVSGRQGTAHLLVKVFTDEGVTGYGGAFIRLNLHTIATFIEEGLCNASG